MARPLAYYLYSNGHKTMQSGNNLDDMIRMAKLHSKVLGGTYTIKDAFGNTVWKGEE